MQILSKGVGFGRRPFIGIIEPMPNPTAQLRVQVVDNNIVVTLPGYRYSVAYYQPEGSSGLLVKHSVVKNDLRIRMTAHEFLAQAWKLANNKAREMGWIV